MIRLISIPSSPASYLLHSFEELRLDARALSKTNENAGFSGQVVGRLLAYVVGEEGVDPSDPLIKIEMIRRALLELVIVSVLM